MYMKICLVGDVLDVITYAKFQKEIFRGYDFTEGRIFLLIFEWALQHCSATALPVMINHRQRSSAAMLLGLLHK